MLKRMSRGFTLVELMVVMAIVALARHFILWHIDAQRAREAELLFIGDQYRQAIRSYYELDPAQPHLPQSLDDLLEDNRRPGIVRHLRRAWRDPLTGRPFALIREPDTQGITGVYSPASGQPLRKAGFSVRDEAFVETASYAGWRFVYLPPARPAPAASPPR